MINKQKSILKKCNNKNNSKKNSIQKTCNLKAMAIRGKNPSGTYKKETQLTIQLNLEVKTQTMETSIRLLYRNNLNYSSSQ